jgi:hypothetical protein
MKNGISPFDTYYLQYVYQKIGKFYWRPFPFASLASKLIRFTCSHPLTSSSISLSPRSPNLCYTLITHHTHPLHHSKPLASTQPRALVHRVHASGLFPIPLCLTVLASVGKKTYMHGKVVVLELILFKVQPTLNHHLIFSSPHLIFFYYYLFP